MEDSESGLRLGPAPVIRGWLYLHASFRTDAGHSHCRSHLCNASTLIPGSGLGGAWRAEGEHECLTLTAANGTLIILDDQGTSRTAEASPEGFKEIARCDVLQGANKSRQFWTPPVLCNAKIYCRNFAGDLVCIDVSKRKENTMKTANREPSSSPCCSCSSSAARSRPRPRAASTGRSGAAPTATASPGRRSGTPRRSRTRRYSGRPMWGWATRTSPSRMDGCTPWAESPRTGFTVSCLDAATGGRSTGSSPFASTGSSPRRRQRRTANRSLRPHRTKASLHALDTKTGKPKWRKDLVADFGAVKPFYGFAGSPMRDGRPRGPDGEHRGHGREARHGRARVDRARAPRGVPHDLPGFARSSGNDNGGTAYMPPGALHLDGRTQPGDPLRLEGAISRSTC